MNRMPSSFSCLTAALAFAAAGLLSSCCCPKAAPAGEALFNGKTLDGWQAVSKDPSVPMDKVWSVRDGVIVCQGEPMGYIRSDKSYTNFQLHVEYRWAPGKTPGNSGIFSRITGEPRALPRCIETQLKNGSAGDLYGFQGFPISGPEARFKKTLNHELCGDFCAVKRLAGAEKTPGEWNKVDITVDGPSLAVRMNGTLVNEASGAEVSAGPVGLQSEGGEIHFRNVRITPLAR